MELPSQPAHYYRKKFPVGYLFHFHPSVNHPFDGVDDPGCARVLLIFWGAVIFHSAHYSYLKITPTGLEYYIYPNNSLKVVWSEVIRLERRKFLDRFPHETLRVNQPINSMQLDDPKPIHLSDQDRQHFENLKLGIPLWQFQGWPEGSLAEDLRRYIPDIIMAAEDAAS